MPALSVMIFLYISVGSQPWEFPRGEIQNWPQDTESKGRLEKGAEQSRLVDAVLISKETYTWGLSMAAERQVNFPHLHARILKVL